MRQDGKGGGEKQKRLMTIDTKIMKMPTNLVETISQV